MCSLDQHQVKMCPSRAVRERGRNQFQVSFGFQKGAESYYPQGITFDQSYMKFRLRIVVGQAHQTRLTSQPELKRDRNHTQYNR